MDLSIIIINFNTPVLTADCIKSIVAQTSGLSYEIILIDNAPNADHVDQFRSVFPTLQYIRSDQNIGFGRANNLGMEAAKGRLLLLLNSDTIVHDNALSQCCAFLDTQPDAGMLGCRLLNEDGSYQPSFYPYSHPSIWTYMLSNNSILYKLSGAAKRFKASTEAREVGDISGAFMLLRRSVFEELKGFDPDFFLYCEETEWCRNRVLSRYKILYYPKVSITHLGGKSAPKAAMQIQAQVSLGLYWYKVGWFSYATYILFNVMNALFYLLTYPFSSSEGKANIRSYLSAFRKSIPYLFGEIPKYPRAYNSRASPLIYEGARSIFFEAAQAPASHPTTR